ncbi:DUF2812 domain-containing protein [Halalkalibacter okhensis]|uniref:DUF2812 domain-containing protein n=1 Tax=Halalkalibacter okhensis TaxID=333138 RepID=A0A0B0ICS4_9BACI|nr:DUF2812 domain-containing protein [Halalkalibacter okhensis]KHF38697.1 hypothetical protein LQ50_19670 [Halalkalibacter okhensis]
MRPSKYVMSEGLAFSEEKDMDKLRKLSLKGWHVHDFKFMGYSLEKGESEEYIYSIDYRLLTKDEEEEYFNFFASSGWSHVASEGDTHLFRAIPGTKPIYSDKDSEVEKHSRSANKLKSLAIPVILSTVLLWIATLATSGIFHTILMVTAAVVTVIAMPLAATTIASFGNKWRVAGRKQTVNLGYLFLIVSSISVAVILLNVVDSSNALFLLAYMVIGGVTFPVAIWAIMSIVQKIGGRRV